MEVPRQLPAYTTATAMAGSELHLLVYDTATATQDLSCVCDLHHSSWQRQNLNPQSKAKGSDLASS